MKDRIRQIREEAGLTQTKFAEILRLSRNFVWLMETGERNISDRTIDDICSAFNINPEWLRTGDGEMHIPLTKNQILAEFVNRVMADKDEAFRKRYLVALSNVPDDGWAYLEKFFDDLYNDSE